MTSKAAGDPAQTSSRPCVLVSWDGESVPLRWIHLDAVAAFDLIVFDYSGRTSGAAAHGLTTEHRVLSFKTECKGQIYAQLAKFLLQQQRVPEYVALVDDDILTSVSAINRLLHIGRAEGLDCFSPTITHDSFLTHDAMLQKPGCTLRPVDWVEVMMPFYKGALFLRGLPHYGQFVSSWGFDRYLMPTLQHLHGMERTALVDAVAISHRRAITSSDKVFSNGMTAEKELQAVRELSLALVHQQASSHPDSDWLQRIFHPPRSSHWQRAKRSMRRRLRRWLADPA
jgi:hypothetical protein